MAAAQFKLLVGVYIDKNAGGTFTAGKAGEDVVESDEDLVAKFGREKFELVSGTPKTKSEIEAAKTRVKADVEAAARRGFDGTDLDTMSIQQLKDHAAMHEIDVGAAKTKTELIDAIKGVTPKHNVNTSTADVAGQHNVPSTSTPRQIPPQARR